MYECKGCKYMDVCKTPLASPAVACKNSDKITNKTPN